MQNIGYLSLALGACCVLYSLAINEDAKVLGFAGVVMVMFGIFKLIKRNDQIAEEEKNDLKNQAEEDESRR